MKMSAHQTPGVNLPVRFRASLRECVQKEFAVLVVLEDMRPVIAPAHAKIDRPQILNSEFSRHANK
jgi:hypothetical protein